jgi:arabinofuranan 3-O-arabinosyltransferase
VIPENTNPGWTARLDGTVLAPVAVDGWQQGYVLPPGAAGTVELTFAPGPYYRVALAVGAGAVLLLLLVAAVPVRPLRERAHRPRRRATALAGALLTAVVVVGTVFGTALAGGLVGLAALAGFWVVRHVAGRGASALLGGAAVAALLVAGGLLLADADATSEVRQLLAVVALAAVVAGVVPLLPWRALQMRRAAAGTTTPGR